MGHGPHHLREQDLRGLQGLAVAGGRGSGELVDPTVPGLTLPLGYPFVDVQSSYYWSVSTGDELQAGAWLVYFANGVVSSDGKSNPGHVWCVRGGMQATEY
jgi:hypothetical protein